MNKRCVYIEWVDSSYATGWVDADDERKPCEIVTVGLVVRETDDHVTIASSLDANGNPLSPLTIPKVAITEQWEVTFD